jgi:HEAT repeat protein
MEREPHLLDDATMRKYIVDGYFTVQTEMPEGFNSDLVRSLDTVLDVEGNWGNNVLPRLPQIQEIFDRPEVRGALTSILGPNYYMHPHRYPHCNVPGSGAQTLHKDSTHYSGDVDIRHHRSRWAMAFYYPQDVSEDMGPTSILPGTHLYEELSNDPENAELLLCGKAGTLTIVHFDIWHRGTANRSDERRWMLKFLFARAEEPGLDAWQPQSADWLRLDHGAAAKHPLAWSALGRWMTGYGHAAPLTGDQVDAGSLGEALTALGSGDTAARRRAANALGRMGPAAGAAIPALAAALRDADEPVRVNTSYALGHIGPMAVPALISELRAGTEIGRRHAAIALGLLGPYAAPDLVAALDDSDWQVRAVAADTLGELGRASPEILAALIRALEDESDWVRRHAADALGTVGKRAAAAAPALARLLADAKPYVRINAATALAKIGSGAHDAVPALVAALRDEDRYVRGFAVLALRRIGTAEAREALLDHLEASRWCPVTTIATPY